MGGIPIKYKSSQEWAHRGMGHGSSTFGFTTLISGGILAFVGYLFLAGIIAWSKELQILVAIGIGIWWLSR